MGTSGANRQSPLGLFPAQPTPRLYDRVVEVLHTRHYSRLTEQTYESGYHIRTVQELLGHSEVKTTMIYTFQERPAYSCGILRSEMAVPRLLVTRSDEVVSGAVVFTGTRVPVQTLLDYLEEGDTLDHFLEDFPTVSREHAVAVLELAKESLFAHADSS